MDSSLSFVQEIKDSYDQSIQVAQLDNLIVISVIGIENDFCECFESGISSQIILKSVVVNVQNFSKLRLWETLVANSYEVRHAYDRGLLDFLIDIGLY